MAAARRLDLERDQTCSTEVHFLARTARIHHQSCPRTGLSFLALSQRLIQDRFLETYLAWQQGDILSSLLLHSSRMANRSSECTGSVLLSLICPCAAGVGVRGSPGRGLTFHKPPKMPSLQPQRQQQEWVPIGLGPSGAGWDGCGVFCEAGQYPGRQST